jgi:hypothetical protein
MKHRISKLRGKNRRRGTVRSKMRGSTPSRIPIQRGGPGNLLFAYLRPLKTDALFFYPKH